MEKTIAYIAQKVIYALNQAHYMQSTVNNYCKSIKYLSEFAGGYDTIYTRELGAAFAAHITLPNGKISRQRYWTYGRIVRVFNSYLDAGEIDLSIWKNRHQSKHPTPTTKDLCCTLDCYQNHLEASTLASTTQKIYLQVATWFLGYCQQNGYTTVNQVTGKLVLDFLQMTFQEANWSKQGLRTLTSNLNSFFIWLNRADLTNGIKLAGIKRIFPLIEPLTNKEHENLLRYCSDNPSNSRDCAIVLLALTCGLRSCDIINLRLGDINWETYTISINQTKTGAPLTLPMVKPLVITLSTWILDQRPKVDDDHVFVSQLAPFKCFADHASIYGIIRRVELEAGISSHGGARRLRHNAATKLLAANTPLPTISAVLGHTSPDSTKIYMSTDIEKLKELVLPLVKPNVNVGE